MKGSQSNTKVAPNALMDPRGRQVRGHLILANRQDLDQLRAGPILLFDNTKLSFGNYVVVFQRIKEILRKKGIDNFIDHRETVRGKSTEELITLAQRVAECKPVAAIIALGDMGTGHAYRTMMCIETGNVPPDALKLAPGQSHTLATRYAVTRI